MLRYQRNVAIRVAPAQHQFFCPLLPLLAYLLVAWILVIDPRHLARHVHMRTLEVR